MVHIVKRGHGLTRMLMMAQGYAYKLIAQQDADRKKAREALGSPEK